VSWWNCGGCCVRCVMEMYKTRSQAETSRNIKRTRYHWKFAGSLEVIDELRRIGVIDFLAKLKGWTEEEYKTGLIDVLIDNEQRIA
jgi:hypothetical protein